MAGNEQIQAFLDNISGKTGATVEDLSSAKKSRFFSWIKEKQLILGDDLDQEDFIDASSDKSSPPLIFASDSSVGVGIDIQHINELKVPESDWKSSAELSKIFSVNEIAYCETRIDPLESLAGIFAAKEAVFKASGLNDQRHPFVEIKHDELGKPIVDLFDVSISHSNGFALAIAIRKPASPAERGLPMSEGGQKSTKELEATGNSPSNTKWRKIVSGSITILFSIIGGAIGCLLALNFLGYA